MRSIILTLLLFSIIGLAITYLPSGGRPIEKRSGAVYVIDGDTVVLDRKHIRLKGMDAPEMQQTCERDGASYDCGKEARDFLRSKIGETTIRCETEGLDQYGRDLARCYLGETDLNGWMVEQGRALAYGDYEREEADAHRNQRGLWAGHFEKPASWRRDHPRQFQKPRTAPPSARETIGDLLHYIQDRIGGLIDRFRHSYL